MGFKLGLEGKLYRGTAGSTASTEITNAQDVTLNLSISEADFSRRAGAGWESVKAVMVGAELSFTIVYDSADANFLALKNAAINRTALAFAVLDGAGGKGVDADFVITGFGRNEPLREGMTCPITAKVYDGNRTPVWAD
jgi:hypothetical protein